MVWELICHMCFYKVKNKRALICHCLIKHKSDGNFIAYCSITPCMYSTKSWNVFKLHFHRKHRNLHLMDHLDNVQMVHSQYCGDNLGEDPHCVDNMSDDDYLNETTTFMHNNDSHNFTYLMILTKYFMSLEADRKMTKTSVTSVATTNKHLMATVLAKCTSKIEKLLRDLNLSSCDINDFVKHFNLEMCE